tara:strand:- start:79 stop:243 length:165 start_codon:yes stop_codon:yes gene_type:complete
MKTILTSLFEYDLIWNGEVIDTASTKKEAIRLRNEYLMAYNTTRIEIKRVPTRD